MVAERAPFPGRADRWPYRRSVLDLCAAPAGAGNRVSRRFRGRGWRPS